MSLDPQQLRGLIRDVLSPVGMWSEDAEELLMMTAAVESNLGTYIEQVGGGPALGIFQAEPSTLQDTVENYLRYRPELANLVAMSLRTEDILYNFKYNLAAQILFVRLHYLRVPKALPNKSDIRALASYHKKYYNTYKGKSIVSETAKKYRRLVL